MSHFASVALDHLSHSQVQSFTMCPRKWHYDKVEHAPKERVGSALIFGCAVHDALASVNEASLHGERIDAPAAFLSAWKQQVADAGVPVAFGKDDADDLLAKGRGLVAAYEPPSGIIGVEQPFSLELDPDLPRVEGRIDLIRRTESGDLAIADIKTAASRVLTDTHAVEAQLGLYDIAYPAAKHEVIVLGKLKTPTVTIQLITPWPMAQVRRHYSEVHAAMAAGVRYAVRGWACEGCQFADRCRKEG
jgi:CRISPR/Cas system-associated exonuclease Cas4 (RecB family)